MKKIIIAAFLLATLCFGYGKTEIDVLEEKAAKYGIDNADTFFNKRDDEYAEYDMKDTYKNRHKDKYKEFVNIEIINILEGIAISKKKIDYSAFIKKQRGEPNISEDRIRNFRETGYYIDEYEKYVKGKL